MKMLTESEHTALVASSSLPAKDEGELLSKATALVARAAELDIVLTIEQRSVPPLAMGRYRTVVDTRPVRKLS